jgi:hypothetical protein
LDDKGTYCVCQPVPVNDYCLTLSTDGYRRNPTLLDRLQREIDATTSMSTCELHTVFQMDDDESCVDSGELGVFSTRHIGKGEQLFVDRSMIADLNSVSKHDGLCDYCFYSLEQCARPFHCCKRTFCSPRCQEKAFSSYHSQLCKQDLRFVGKQDRSSRSGLNPVMLLPRLLALLSKSEKSKHPLSHPVLSRWKADFRSSQPLCFPFSFEDNIRTPLQILMELDVDIFAEERFDTWVVQNILNRMTTNALLRYPLSKVTDPRLYSHHSLKSASAEDSGLDLTHPFLEPTEVISLGYLLPLFNHCCSPNLSIAETSGGVCIKANRDIERGEELCVSYVDENLPEQDRKEVCWHGLASVSARNARYRVRAIEVIPKLYGFTLHWISNFHL